MNRAAFIAASLALGLFAPSEAQAVRWTLGVATELTPVVVEPGRPEGLGAPVRLGVRPVIDFELTRSVAFSAYAPFVVLRTGEGDGAASSGAESVFGLGLSLRYPVLFAEPPEELLVYGALRGGFGTVSGRAGPYVSGALGAAITWLDTGRGVFGELSAGHVSVADAPVTGGTRDVTRTSLTLTFGVVFRLGGETWSRHRPKL